MELVKKSDNATVTAAFAELGVKIDSTCRVICMLPTIDKTTGELSKTKSTVFVIAEVPGLSTDSKDYSRMSMLERLAQGYSTETLLRGRFTINNEFANNLKPGDAVEFNGEKAVLRVHESFKNFYPGQNPVQRKVNGVLEPRLKNGKKFYRDTKVVLESELLTSGHQLLAENTVTGVIE